MTPANAHAEMMQMQYKLVDKFYLKTGVDADILNYNADRLSLDKDPEYEKMLKDYNEEIQNLEK